MSNDDTLLKERYDAFALSQDYRTTASDYQLRELEIDTGASYMRDGIRTLDVGCGLGYAVAQYASRFDIEAHGIDYSENMIAGARELLAKNYPQLQRRATFTHASVMELPFADNHFDVVTSHRCLMALLDWEKQKAALKEIRRVLKPGGVLVLMEGTFEGLDRLNAARQRRARADRARRPRSPDHVEISRAAAAGFLSALLSPRTDASLRHVLLPDPGGPAVAGRA
jgi:ubiquinone/menaquinone biosynthesis C-methylase UbiE